MNWTQTLGGSSFLPVCYPRMYTLPTADTARAIEGCRLERAVCVVETILTEYENPVKASI